MELMDLMGRHSKKQSAKRSGYFASVQAMGGLGLHYYWDAAAVTMMLGGMAFMLLEFWLLGVLLITIGYTIFFSYA
jgi:hypothetical protein